TLAGGLLSRGATLLTDDLLLVRRSDDRILAYPGPPRIKLLPDSAEQLFAGTADAIPMNALTSKKVIPLSARMRNDDPAPLCMIYALAHGRSHAPRFTALSPRAAALALIANTFNRVIDDPARLGRQLTAVGWLSRSVPVKRLAYARVASRLGDVVDALLS